MSEVPLELGYAATHEWAKQDEEGLIVVGISDHAQDALGGDQRGSGGFP